MLFKSKKRLVNRCTELQQEKRSILKHREELVKLNNYLFKKNKNLVKENEALKRREETLLKVIDKQINIKCMLSTKLIAAQSKLDKLEKYISEIEGI